MAETIRTVRQARAVKPEAVPDDVLAELLEVARWTGSSRNTQPWHFVVITDKEVLTRLAGCARPSAGRPGRHWGLPWCWMGRTPRVRRMTRGG